MPSTGNQELGRLLQEVRAALVTIPGLRRVHWDVPDAIGPYPCIVVYPSGFTCYLASHAGEGGNPMYWTLHTIRIELHLPHKDLGRDMETVIAFQHDIPQRLYVAFEQDEFGGTMILPGHPELANNSTANIRGSLIELGWGSDATIGYRIEFEVTTESEIFA